MTEPMSVPVLKYADLNGQGKKLVDEMIARLVRLLETPEILANAGNAAIRAASPEARRRTVIELLDRGALKLSIRMGCIGWMVYSPNELRYVPIGRMPEPTDN